MHIIILYNNMPLSEIFYTSLYTSLIGFVLAMGSQCYRSKCSKVEFCCIKIIRDTAGEEQLDAQQPRNPILSNNNL